MYQEMTICIQTKILHQKFIFFLFSQTFMSQPENWVWTNTPDWFDWSTVRSYYLFQELHISVKQTLLYEEYFLLDLLDYVWADNCILHLLLLKWTRNVIRLNDVRFRSSDVSHYSNQIAGKDNGQWCLLFEQRCLRDFLKDKHRLAAVLGEHGWE